MNNDFLNLKEQQVLYQFKEYLENLSVESTLMEASAVFPVNLLVAVTPDMATINIMYVPLPEDHFKEIRLIQHHCLIIEKIEEERRDDLLLLLNELNNQTPAGTFTINEKGEIGYKYIYPVSRFDMIQEKSFLEIFSLYVDCLMGLRNSIIHVNSGALPIADALKDVMTG